MMVVFTIHGASGKSSEFRSLMARGGYFWAELYYNIEKL
jgi:hypothetical protein